ncbi:hypothetical protein HOD29_02015 [archaeon]|jgi:hypothetical protein|nr:hypothetical protein [archaeon]
MSARNDLISNAKEYFKNALFAQKRREYNTSVTLFFKTLSALADLYLLEKENQMPSSHSERFRILQNKYPEIYGFLDKDFPLYQQSYRSKLNAEVSKIFENDCRKIFEIINIRI